MAEITNEDLQWVSATQDTSEEIKELNHRLERRKEMLNARNTQITQLTAQVEILMRVIKER